MQSGLLPGQSHLVKGPESRFLCHKTHKNTPSITLLPNFPGREEGTGIQQSRQYILICLTHLLGKYAIHGSEVNFHRERVASDQDWIIRFCWKAVLEFADGSFPWRSHRGKGQGRKDGKIPRPQESRANHFEMTSNTLPACCFTVWWGKYRNWLTDFPHPNYLD